MRLIVEYVRRVSGDGAVARMLDVAGEVRPLSDLENEGVWSTYAQKVALFEAAAQVTGRPDIAREIGETVLASSVGTTLKVALGMLGSPGSLLRMIARANAKFSTAAEMQAAEVTRTSGVVHYRLRADLVPSAYDCDYTAGLLTQVPALFGLPPATVEHDDCRARGADACIFRLRWQRRTRVPWRRSRPSIAADALLSRLHELQATLGDLVATRDVDEVLDAIAARAGAAVSAERFVLAARLDDDDPVRVRFQGFDPRTGNDVAVLLLSDAPPAAEGQHALVVDVRTSVRSYGRLAAFATYPFLEHEQELLEAYGRLAATALDAVTALASAEDRRRTAEALLGLAGQLHAATTGGDVAAVVVEAAQRVVDADVVSMLLLDEDELALRVVGHSGFPDDLVPLLGDVLVRREDTPELDDLLAHPEQPRLYDDRCDDAYLRGLLQAFRTRLIAVVPIAGGGRVRGALIAGWSVTSPTPRITASLLARLAGLADQATNALEKAELVDKVHLQATTDALTGVANRRLLTDRIHEALATAPPAAPPALLFLDLDRFKLVNDTLGHGAGDELLKEVAERLQRCVRTDDLVARLGGDEFTVLLPSVATDDDAMDLAARVVDALDEPVVVAGRTVHVRGSVGVVVVRDRGRTASDVLRDADAAMYDAKTSGGNRCVLFDPARLGSDSDVLDLESDLYAAVSQQALSVAFQPQVDLVTETVKGVECLVRWNHPTRGNVPPDRFLPVAEASGLIVALDLWVLRTACAQASDWREAGCDLRVAINVSARTLTDPAFLPAVVAALADHDVPSGGLEVELTEATAIADVDTVRTVLEALRDVGVTVAVDDLGTGYSSLLWVSSFPIDRIKIDRSFVADLDTGGRGAPLVEALIGIARRLGHGVLAEGVETQTQVQRLLTMGCSEAQGFLLGRPCPADEIPALALALPRQRDDDQTGIGKISPSYSSAAIASRRSSSVSPR